MRGRSPRSTDETLVSFRGEGGEGRVREWGTHFMRSRRLATMEPRIPTNAGIGARRVFTHQADTRASSAKRRFLDAVITIARLVVEP